MRIEENGNDITDEITDTITVFRAARPGVAPYDQVARARTRARLINGPARPAAFARGGPLASRRLLTLGALTMALAFGITVVQNIEFRDDPVTAHRTPATPRLLGPVANAGLADKAAVWAAAQPDGHPRADQWGYVKHLMADSSSGSGGRLFGPPDKRVTVERWYKADGTQSAYLDHGDLRIRVLSEMERGGSPRRDYPYLLGLPDSADALLARAFDVADSEGGGRMIPPDDRAGRAFQIIQVWVRDSALPPKLRAAMFGALAKIPGVRYEPRAKDLIGRRGVALYRIEEGYLRTEIIIDPATYTYMGFRNIAIRNGPKTMGESGERSQSRKGEVLGWGATLKTAIVDKPGRRA